jgi:hypothetical protein
LVELDKLLQPPNLSKTVVFERVKAERKNAQYFADLISQNGSVAKISPNKGNQLFSTDYAANA